MPQDIFQRYQSYMVRRRRRSVLKKVVSVLACTVIFCTTYALILPAITMETQTFCGMDEHQHDTACYAATEEKTLICTGSSLQIHTHSEGCYNTEGVLSCGQADYVIHNHAGSCYDNQGNLACTLDEHEAHVHIESCYVPAETQPPVYHIHTESCNVSQRDQLVCTVPEYEGHIHTDICYEPGTKLLCSTVENHIHSNSCYINPLNCTLSTEPHAHNDSCQGRGEQTCTVQEGHVHTDACREEFQSCQNTEENHQHDGSCYTVNTTCAIPENHAHNSGCYETILVCGKTEGEAHTHSDSCFSTEREQTCTIPENHVHENGCYEPVLVCTTAEAPGHAHNDDCYNWITVIGCGLEDGQEEPTEPAEPVLNCTEPAAQVHVHDENCFETVTTEAVPLCGNQEEGHEHGADCYELICSMEIHSHILSCYSDPDADLETAGQWEATFAGVELTGNWNEDVVAIAETQLGYTESSRNYAVWEDGTTHGYTRYGQWYGVPYGDWCGMFVSFCLNYAGVEGMPLNYGVRPWIEDLSKPELDLYRLAEEYTPIPGDLVFFDWEDDGLSDHVGIVYKVIPSTETQPAILKTIEGNSSNCVQIVTYDLSDSVLLGYSMLPEKEDAAIEYFCGLTEHTHGDTCLDEHGELTCTISEHLHSEDCLSSAELFYCGIDIHSHSELCYDAQATLVCGLEAHQHTSVCRADLSNLDEVTRQNIISIIQRIDEIPSADEIDARIAEFEATEDYEGEELWMTQTYQQIASVYAGYAQLSEELQAYVINRDKLLELEYIWSVMPLVEATIRLDGTNGDLIGLYGAPNESYTATVGQQFTLPTTWQSPTKHNYKLRGWYQINAINDVTTGKEYDENLTPNDCYYLPGQTITVTGDMIFYADWMPTHYNIGENNDRVVSTVSTNDFVTTHLFDYSSIFNMYSSKYVDTSGTRKGYSEEWTALDHGQRLPNGKTSYGIILRDWDDGDQNVGHHLSKPSNFTNYAQFNTQGTNVTTGLMSKSPSLKDLFFNPSTTFRINENQTISGVLGTHYVGTADHLFQYDNNKNSATYGYYYYDSSQNAAAYNQSEARFYVYNYEEETQSSSSKDGQFLPFNSPYVDKPQHTNGMYVYDHKNSLGAQYSGANFWFGMRNEIHFYLPNDSGSTTSNLSMQGKQMEFRFSGDDDVWIYVDNELVLDIGGLHEAKSGTINFSTGVVKLGNTTITLNRKENEPAFCAGEHTLTMYYMERGATMSNCSIYFNLSPRFKLTLNKVNSDKQPLTGSEFQVFMDADCQTAATLWHTYDAYLVDLKDNQINSSTNVLNVAENGTASIWGFSPGNTYYIKETVPPDSSGYILPNGLIMVVLDSAGNATYSAVVIEDENGPEENNPSPGYEVLEFVLNESSHTMTLTIQNSYPSTELSVSKVWEGVDAESVPDSVQIELLAQYGNTTDAGNAVPTVVDTVALDKDNNWQHTWTKLPKFHTTRTVGQGGAITIETKEITYSVCEIEIQGFEASISPVTATSGSIAGYVVTNTAIPDVELTSLAVEKMWLDRNGEPADENLYNDLSVRIKLMADGEYSGQFVDLSKANNWTHTFINLPETDTDNNPIAYSVEEDWQNSDWTSDVAYDETRNVWDVTNTYSRMLTIEVEKSWVASAVPSSITIQLYEVSNDGAGQLAVPVEGGTIELKAPDWKGEFKVIPPDEKGVTYYIYEPTYSFAAEYDSPAKIYTYASNGETETTKQIDVGEVTVNDETGDVNTVSIINYAMEELPNTGGAGTASYTAGGLLITAAALLLMYFSKKRPGMKDAQSSLWDYPK